MAQASDFGTPFTVLSVGLTAAIYLLGVLTGVRVPNASFDDASYVLGMNRLRAAYWDIDPGIEPYRISGWTDDQAGLMLTYLRGVPRSLFSHAVGSTSFFMNVVNSIVAGALGAVIALAAGGSSPLIAVVGTATGLLHLGLAMVVSQRTFATVKIETRFPSRPS